MANIKGKNGRNLEFVNKHYATDLKSIFTNFFVLQRKSSSFLIKLVLRSMTYWKVKSMCFDKNIIYDVNMPFIFDNFKFVLPLKYAIFDVLSIYIIFCTKIWKFEKLKNTNIYKFNGKPQTFFKFNFRRICLFCKNYFKKQWILVVNQKYENAWNAKKMPKILAGNVDKTTF